MQRSAIAGLVLSIAAVLGAPVLLIVVSLTAHAFSYRGMCGPYPTDIPAFPCGFGEYMRNFAGPFALVGLVMLSIAAAFVAAVLVALAWLGWGIVRAVRR